VQFRRRLEHNHAYLVTTNSHERRPLFRDLVLAQIIVDTLRFYRDRDDFALHAYVVMPDHLHLLLTPRQAQLPDIMRNVKSFSARQIREVSGTVGPVWQSRFHDRGIWTEDQFLQAAGYVHNNPVKAGLVNSAEGCRFSSAALYSGATEVPLGIDMADGSRLGP
jgi:REP element-mobilizing transposase RayT